MRTIKYEGHRYVYKTTTTNHQRCMNALGAKCRWEAMPKLAVLIEWPNIVCRKCQKKMDIHTSPKLLEKQTE